MGVHQDLIKQLGGGSAVAEAASASGFALDRNRVYRWVHDDNIPWRWRPLVAQLAAARGVALPSNFLMPEAPDKAEDAASSHASPDVPTEGSSNGNTDEESVTTHAPRALQDAG